uniref:Uncharacterized protein n=1 Tax=Pararge aegeria TaxID=116150 RepID=S4NMQ9_9NEOP
MLFMIMFCVYYNFSYSYLSSLYRGLFISSCIYFAWSVLIHIGHHPLALEPFYYEPRFLWIYAFNESKYSKV